MAFPSRFFVAPCARPLPSLRTCANDTVFRPIHHNPNTTVIGCGDRMDVAAVRTSLRGLREQAQNGTPLPHKLLEAVGVQHPRGARSISRSHAEGNVACGRGATDAEKARVVKAIDNALKKLDTEGNKCPRGVTGRPSPSVTRVDLCFVMDCTRSVRENPPSSGSACVLFVFMLFVFLFFGVIRGRFCFFRLFSLFHLKQSV